MTEEKRARVKCSSAESSGVCLHLLFPVSVFFPEFFEADEEATCVCLPVWFSTSWNVGKKSQTHVMHLLVFFPSPSQSSRMAGSSMSSSSNWKAFDLPVVSCVGLRTVFNRFLASSSKHLFSVLSFPQTNVFFFYSLEICFPVLSFLLHVDLKCLSDPSFLLTKKEFWIGMMMCFRYGFLSFFPCSHFSLQCFTLSLVCLSLGSSHLPLRGESSETLHIPKLENLERGNEETWTVHRS